MIKFLQNAESIFKYFVTRIQLLLIQYYILLQGLHQMIVDHKVTGMLKNPCNTRYFTYSIITVVYTCVHPSSIQRIIDPLFNHYRYFRSEPFFISFVSLFIFERVCVCCVFLSNRKNMYPLGRITKNLS